MARAVDGFVVLSGFIIARTVLTNDGLSIQKFMLLRLIRLSPSYYLAIAAIISANFVVGRTNVDSVDVLLHLAYSHNFFNDYTQGLDGAFWSVGLEMSLYVTFAILLSIARRSSIPLVWLLIVSNVVCFLICIFVRVYNPEFTESFLYGRHLFSRWITFSAGVWLFLSNGQLLRSNLQRLIWLALAVTTALVLITGKLPFLHNYFWTVIVTLVMNFILSNRPVSAIMSKQPFQWFGTISYPMYLIHGTVFCLCSHFGKTVSFDRLADKNVFVYLSVPIVFAAANVISLVESKVIRVLKGLVR